MNLQYISDSTGKTTGVFIPISEWNKLKNKYNDIDDYAMDVPEWQINQVRNRLEEYKKDPNKALDFETSLKEIENDLQMYKSIILPLAKQDIKEAALWYNNKQKGLGKNLHKKSA